MFAVLPDNQLYGLQFDMGGNPFGTYFLFTPGSISTVLQAWHGVAQSDVVTPPPVPPVIISEKTIFQRKTNKKGKPIGSPVLTGFTITFNAPLNAATALNRSNYQLDTVTTKKVKKKTTTILHPITRFTVSYVTATNSVDVTLIGTQAFPAGGRLTIVSTSVSGVTGALASGVTGASGAPSAAPRCLPSQRRERRSRRPGELKSSM